MRCPISKWQFPMIDGSGKKFLKHFVLFTNIKWFERWKIQHSSFFGSPNMQDTEMSNMTS